MAFITVQLFQSWNVQLETLPQENVIGRVETWCEPCYVFSTYARPPKFDSAYRNGSDDTSLEYVLESGDYVV
jgi:hypothetical protein